MKYLITLLLAFNFSAASAQIVNIPDPVFKNSLLAVPTINTNGDSEIQLSEALAVTYLNIKGIWFSDTIRNFTGIESFQNTRGLSLEEMQIDNWDDIITLFNLTDLDINHNKTVSLDLTNQPNLETLLIGSMQLTSLNLAGLSNLKTLRLEVYPALADYNFTALSSLESFSCSGLIGARIDFSGMTQLQNFYLASQVDSLDFHGLTRLKQIDCSYSPIKSIVLNGCDSLKVLHFENDNLTSLDFSGLQSLEQVYSSSSSSLITNIKGNNALRLQIFDWVGTVFLKNISLKNCPLLTSLSINTGEVDTIDVSGCTGIQSVFFSNIHNLVASNCTGLRTIKGNQILNSMDVSGCTSLYNLDIFEYAAELMDLSSCANLYALMILVVNPNCKYINIKNGSLLQNLSIDNLPPSLNICTDDFETDTVISYLSMHSVGFNDMINVSSICSFFPGGNYNTIKGKVRIDVNNNGCEPTDPGMANVPIRITDADGNTTVRYSVFSGAYAHYPGAGNFTLNPYFAYPYFNIAPLTANVSFATASNLIDSVDFCITPNGTHNDLEISLLPISFARPGFQTVYKLVYKNKGTTTQSGNVQLNFDNSKMGFDVATPTVSSQSAGQLVWNYSNLLPFESRSADVNFTLLPPPVNNVGDTIYFMAAINPVANDETAYDNSFILPQAVRGSFDPNDKECLEGPKLSIASLDKYLHYMIRFQNLGTDTAFNVVVNDALSDKFDWNTVEIVSSSHTCDVKQIKNKLEFYFRDIKLPYAAINEPASHGFVAFKVKTKAGAVIGDSLNNKAAIYFDFNLPVITNTASTVVSPTSSVPVKLEYFSLSSKPSGNLLTWKASSTNGITKFGIEKSNDGIHFNNFGNITATTDRCQLPFNFTDDKPFDGKTFYRLNITDADGFSFYSKVLVAGKNKSGLQITAVVSDRNNTIAYLNASKQQNIQMKIIAADGKSVYNQSKTIMPGNSILNLSLKNIASGIYTLIIYTNEGETLTKRFTK